ncbi:MAG: zincin-like metallopeptidase domain-containing protein [Betaproteobacteria bacterium]|nr:zincin-like metallopeptidase domain-containing protein [Betaproteobacteria bacterium]
MFDLAKCRVIANVPSFPGATGTTIVPSLHRTFVSVTGHWWNDVLDGGKIGAIDAITLKTAWSVPVGRFPDGSAFVPKDRHYRIAEDRVYMPELSAFRDGTSYAGTLLHEAAHYAAFRIMPRSEPVDGDKGALRHIISA